MKYIATHMAKKCNKFPTLFHFKVGEYVATHMAKKCNKFPTLFHIKFDEIYRNGYGEKMQ